MTREKTDVAALTIEHNGEADRGRYHIPLPDGSAAELTYTRRSDGAMVINHTGVPPAYEGQGIALRLVEAAVADARDKGFAIVPRCPYVAAQFRRHPDWSPLLAN